MPLNFALTGAAGYIAPRHMEAIRETENHLVAVLDPHDSIGVLDSHFPNVAYFREVERFDRHLSMINERQGGDRIDCVSICSPNYVHDAHIRMALRCDADAICEKPMVLNPWNCDRLQELEKRTGRRIFSVLQLRLHPSVVSLRDKVKLEKRSKKYNVELTYITSRGPWYLYSWKGDAEKSGGLATNIGIHFFDMLLWLFGDVKHQEVHCALPNKIGGFIELEHAYVKWFLSIDRHDLPEAIARNGQRTYRSILVDEEEIVFSKGFEDLHTRVYKDILSGGGFGIDATRPAIELAHRIRNAPSRLDRFNAHPMLAGNRLEMLPSKSVYLEQSSGSSETEAQQTEAEGSPKWRAKAA